MAISDNAMEGQIMRFVSYLLIAVVLCLPAPAPVGACTVFVLDDGPKHYYGSNFDWHTEGGYVMVNQRGVTKQAWSLPQDPGRPVEWQSKFGSLTFVHFGTGFPKGGMNEAGLAIESLMLPGTRYEPADERPYVGSTSHLNQYLLDTCATVADVVRQLSGIRVATYDWAPGIHYMVADARGDCAVIEFLEGQVKIYRGENLPMKVLANQAYSGPGVSQNPKTDVRRAFISNAGGRIRRAAARLAAYDSTISVDAVTYAMETLEEVSAGAYTKWQTVYDQHNRKVFWQCTSGDKRRWIDLRKVDFNCGHPLQALPIETDQTGEVNSSLAVFTPEDNRRLVYEAVKNNQSVIPIPETIRDAMWQWPQREKCMEEKQEDISASNSPVKKK